MNTNIAITIATSGKSAMRRHIGFSAAGAAIASFNEPSPNTSASY
jgi:hypothetical protein